MALLMQTFGHNRARQRDKIPALLEELALVQEEVIQTKLFPNLVGNNSLKSSKLNLGLKYKNTRKTCGQKLL